jgi:hypothetical protein
MARMIPDQPAHQSSEAELWLFREMRLLPEDFIVLHSLGLARHEHKRWSEIDFVVVCPDGVFLLEVKGGVVERTNGQWFVTDRNSKKESLGRGPFAQVGGAEAATRRFLRDRLPEIRSVTMGYAVVMPDCVLNLDGLDVDPAVCFDASNLPLGMRSLLASLAMHWRGRIPAQSEGLDPRMMKKVVDLLCADVRAIASIQQRVAGALSEIHAATLEQEYLLADLHFQPRVVVRGPAGSGKSTIAFNECKLRAQAGQKIIYLCHTRSFADRLRKACTESPNLNIVSVDQFASFVNTHEHVDLLVIDEGQDTLASVSRDDLERVIRGGIANGSWRLLLDPFQLLDDGNDASNQVFFEESATTSRTLELNVRGTVEVALASSALGYVDRIYGGIHGPEVNLHYCDAPALWDQVLVVVEDWVTKGIVAEDILVLVSGAELRQAEDDMNSQLHSLRANLIKLGVGISTPAEMKGWESAAVVYAGARELESIPARRETYLACSRAQVLLTVIGFDSLEEHVPLAYAAAIARDAVRKLS